MMPGVAAQPLGRRAAPSGATTALLDFVNGLYSAGGADYAVGALLGGGFDQSYITADGMQIATSNLPKAIGPLFDAFHAGLAAGMTITFTFSQTSSDDRFLIAFEDETGSPDWALRVERVDLNRNTPSDDFYISDFDALDFSDELSALLSSGINRFAVTLGRDLGGGMWRYAVSANGSTALTADVAYSAADGFAANGLAIVRIGARFDAWPDGYIRSIALSPALDEALLPALTAPVLAFADYRAGVYAVADMPVDLADIVDQPELVDATGLAIADGGTVVAHLGAFRDVMLGNGTRIIEWDHFDATGNILPAVIVGAGSDDVVQVKRQNALGSHLMDLQDFSGIHFRRANDASAPVGDGVHKIAWTRTDSLLEFSIDGRAAVTYAGDPDTFSLAATDSCYGGYPGDTTPALTIRSDRMIAAVDISLLPALSA